MLVRGPASAEELAAVLAAVAAARPAPQPGEDALGRWRRGRVEALRRTASRR